MPIWREEFKEVNDKRVLRDLIKYQIRQVTIKFSKEKASATMEKLKILEDSLKVCEDECGKDPSPKMRKSWKYLGLSTTFFTSTYLWER